MMPLHFLFQVHQDPFSNLPCHISPELSTTGFLLLPLGQLAPTAAGNRTTSEMDPWPDPLIVRSEGTILILQSLTKLTLSSQEPGFH